MNTNISNRKERHPMLKHHTKDDTTAAEVPIVNTYEPHSWYYCIDAYKPPKNESEWQCCPKCGLKPKIWVFDNGEHTACGCWEDKYRHFDIQADETIGEVVRRTGGFAEYDRDAHRRKWNAYCEAAEAKHGRGV